MSQLRSVFVYLLFSGRKTVLEFIYLLVSSLIAVTISQLEPVNYVQYLQQFHIYLFSFTSEGSYMYIFIILKTAACM